MKGNIAVLVGVLLMVIVFLVHRENGLAAVGMIAGFVMIAGGLVLHEIEGGEFDDQV